MICERRVEAFQRVQGCQERGARQHQSYSLQSNVFVKTTAIHQHRPNVCNYDAEIRDEMYQFQLNRNILHEIIRYCILNLQK